jgi:DNA-binding beta-propeller fold protein YncE
VKRVPDDRARWTTAAVPGLIALLLLGGLPGMPDADGKAGPNRALAASPQSSPTTADADYWLYVAAESEDEVALVRFGPDGAAIERTIPVGSFPTDIDGPHGIAIHPDGSRWYVSIAHGMPYGEVVAYSTATNERIGRVTAGLFPATMAVDPAGLLFVANFNLHGDHVPGTISVIETGSMLELTRIETCTMPHGARMSPDGGRIYSACMMDDRLVEIDGRTLSVSRVFDLTPGDERQVPATELAAVAAPAHVATEEASRHAGDHGDHEGGASDDPLMRCSPTWVEIAPADDFAYVACNKNAEVLELELASGSVQRRFATGKGPYNLAISPDGRRMVVTYKGAQATGIFDLASGEERAVDNTRRIPHGVVISPDSRFAFISVEGIGGEPGTVDVIDLASAEVVASVDMGKQAGGIGFWKMNR